MAAIRRSTAVWEGDLFKGKGNISADTSQAYTDLPVTWGSRIEKADGRTSPEELIASAHAGCFSMALAHTLNQAGSPPQRLQVEAAVSFDAASGSVSSSALTVRGVVPGIEGAAFQQAAESAKENCPVSKALKGNVELTVQATLDQG